MIYALLVVGSIMFVAIPALFILGGIVVGMVSIYYGYTTFVAEKMIAIVAFTYLHWQFFLPVVLVTSLGIVSFTAYARKTAMYRKIRVKKR